VGRRERERRGAASGAGAQTSCPPPPQAAADDEGDGARGRPALARPADPSVWVAPPPARGGADPNILLGLDPELRARLEAAGALLAGGDDGGAGEAAAAAAAAAAAQQLRAGAGAGAGAGGAAADGLVFELQAWPRPRPHAEGAAAALDEARPWRRKGVGMPVDPWGQLPSDDAVRCGDAQRMSVPAVLCSSCHTAFASASDLAPPLDKQGAPAGRRRAPHRRGLEHAAQRRRTRAALLGCAAGGGASERAPPDRTAHPIPSSDGQHGCAHGGS
jgi:hypothetical protein